MVRRNQKWLAWRKIYWQIFPRCRKSREPVVKKCFLDIVSKDKRLKYNGYSYRLGIRPKTNTSYMPLLDIVTTNSTTTQTSDPGEKKNILNTEKGFEFIYTSNNIL